MSGRTTITLLGLAVLAAGCAREWGSADAASAATSGPAGLGPGGEAPAASGSVPRVGIVRAAGLDEAIRAARADAARRTGLAPEAFELVSAESVNWGDGSLGCPQPGMAYTQALVPGYRIRLRGPAGVLDYHASARGGLVLCPAGRGVEPVPGDSRV